MTISVCFTTIDFLHVSYVGKRGSCWNMYFILYQTEHGYPNTIKDMLNGYNEVSKLLESKFKWLCKG